MIEEVGRKERKMSQNCCCCCCCCGWISVWSSYLSFTDSCVGQSASRREDRYQGSALAFSESVLSWLEIEKEKEKKKKWNFIRSQISFIYSRDTKASLELALANMNFVLFIIIITWYVKRGFYLHFWFIYASVLFVSYTKIRKSTVIF